MQTPGEDPRRGAHREPELEADHEPQPRHDPLEDRGARHQGGGQREGRQGQGKDQVDQMRSQKLSAARGEPHHVVPPLVNHLGAALDQELPAQQVDP